MVALFQNKTLHDLRSLAIMDKQYTWPKDMTQALSHYLTWLIQQCDQTTEPKPQTKNALGLLRDDVVEGYKNLDKDEKRDKGRVKKRADAEQMDQEWPLTKDIKANVKQDMIDLYWAVQEYQGTNGELARINMLILGILG